MMKAKNLKSRSFERVFLVFTIVLGLFGSNYGTANATGITYYVDNTNTSCSDAGPGTSPSAPFCTITRGASAAVAGDVVQVLAGTYAETVTILSSGTASLPITFTAAPGVTVSGSGSADSRGFVISSKSYITINGFTVTGTRGDGIYVTGSNNITISNNSVSYAGDPSSGLIRRGIRFISSNNSTITGNTTSYNSQDGIRLESGCYNVMVSYNTSFGNAEEWQRNAAGIDLNNSYSNTILHNITFANEDTGLQFYSGSHDNLVIGNLTYGNGDHGIDNLS